MTLIIVLLLCVYVVTIGQLIYGFGKVKPFHPSDLKPKTFFAIVVPFRNESANLPQLLDSIKNLDYPEDLFEIILVDDFSEDDSVRQFYNWRMENGKFQTTLLENIRLSGSPKKDAISRAVPIIKHDWVVTTDADCVLPTSWLAVLDNYIQSNEVIMVAGAVTYDCKKFSFLHHFQQLDLTSLQGATIGSFGLGIAFMCNGANFAYKKSVFQELNGFEGNNQTASGDDVFLLQRAMQKYPEQVHYLKNEAHIVVTQPMHNWKNLISQRMRWASKTGSYQSVFGKDLAVIVFLANLAFVVGLAFCCFGLMPWSNLALLFAIKFVVDTILLYKTNRFLTQKWMHFLTLSSLLYPLFCVFVALFSMTGSYEWKGRKFKS